MAQVSMSGLKDSIWCSISAWYRDLDKTAEQNTVAWKCKK